MRTLIAFLLLLSLSACQRKSETVPISAPAAPPSSNQPAAASKPATTGNQKAPVLFSAPRFELTDQYGQPYSSQALVGRVWVANFIFTHCQATCPRQTSELSKLQSRIQSWPHGDRVRLLSITVDPERDTPDRLMEYAEQHSADHTHWKFLTGTRQQLWTLSKDGFKFPVTSSPNADGLITHSSRFVLVDAQGQVRGLYESLESTDIKRLTSDMLDVLSEPVMNPPDPVIVGAPADVFDPPWLAGRAADQLAQADSINAFHDFQFEDQCSASGITFVHHPVADSTKEFRSNHYDHGNGLAVADVDGDQLPDLYFVNQRGANELWRNLGNAQFENITERAGVAFDQRASVSASFADVDNDGDADLFVTATRHGNALLLNDGTGKFEDITEKAGVKYSGHSSAADFFDYDRDGRLDLLLTNVGKFTTAVVGYSGDKSKQEYPYYIGEKEAFGGHLFPPLRERSLIYHNEGNGQFRNVTDDLGFKEFGWTGDATPMDLDGDGWCDIYIANMQGNDIFYKNIAGQKFEDASRQYFPVPVWGGMGLKSFDVNNDGLMDLMVTSMHADMWELNAGILGPERERLRAPDAIVPSSYLRSRDTGKNVLGNALFKAKSSGSFEEVAETFNAENYWPWGLSVADLNADGFQDVFITSSMNYPFRYQVNSLRLNEAGQRFCDAEFIVGVEPRHSGKTAGPWFTLDCDGEDRDHKLAKGHTGKIEVWGALGSRSSAIVDLDADGDLDIVTNDFNSAPLILVSNLSVKKPKFNWLKIQLEGTGSNRDALATKVVLHVGQTTMTQVNDGQSGYLSQSRVPLYFGLGDSNTIDQISITWPDQTTQTLPGPIQSNQTLNLKQPREGEATAEPNTAQREGEAPAEPNTIMKR